jgi:hypothetical protein
MAKELVLVVNAEYVGEYQIRLRFSDGVSKTVDFSRWLGGKVFHSLRDYSEFRRFFIAGGTVCWPNGADIAPETLRDAQDVATTAA